MRKENLNWTLSHMASLKDAPQDQIPAKVPGAVQLDYAAAKDYPPYWFGLNFRQFNWMEDEYFLYASTLSFDVNADEKAFLYFGGIDYRFLIRIDEKPVYEGEGMFTPVTLDVTEYAGKTVPLEVIIYPIPKIPGAPLGRWEAAWSCKPASSYGWDWHPRLIPSGIWDEAYVKIVKDGSPVKTEISYRMADDLKSVSVHAETEMLGEGPLTLTLAAPDGTAVYTENRAQASGTAAFDFTLEDPELWYPRGYGKQPVYTLTTAGNETVSRKIGFRRAKLIRNENDGERFSGTFPKGPYSAPITAEVNGRKIFAKGSNWVNTEIFPALITDARMDELLQYAFDANMNILRLWGGQFIYRDHFYDKCDELGIMIWQEFMLSCNLHPDDDHYLSVLKQEATTTIKRLRTHPCLTLWCGGNELFNDWSGMTEQSHPLRLLNTLCYELDRFTPFNMTAPLFGMAHGSYVKAVIDDAGYDAANDDPHGHEFIEDVKNSDFNTYDEFGCNGGATPEYLKKYIMDEETYQDCRPENEVWTEHHAFGAWNGDHTWLGKSEVKFYFGGYDSIDDLMEKSLYLQTLVYKSFFEETRRHWPNCSMTLNWDFNEPWPCAAGNSLINWPAEPKAAYYAVKDALRPTIASLNMPHNRFLPGETFTGELWVLNDSDETAAAMTVDIYLENGDEKKRLGTLQTGEVAPRENAKFDAVSFPVTEALSERFRVTAEVREHPEFSSYYDLICRH